MKRGWPLRRTTGLKSTSSLKRTTLKAGGGLTRGTVKRRKTVPVTKRAKAYVRSGGRCVVCRRAAATQLHHVLPVQRWPEHELDDRNMVGVCPGCHDNHERAHRRIGRHELPWDVVAFVLPLEAAYFDRTYPLHVAEV